MYNFCFKSCLVTVAIATAIGVASIWVPDAWHEVGSKLFYTNGILFAGSVTGAILCFFGIVGDKVPDPTAASVAAALRKEIKRSNLAFPKDQ